MRNVLVNASNLHVGGGVQVAVSFIDELSRMCFDDMRLYLSLSTEVLSNLKAMGTSFDRFAGVDVDDVHGIKAVIPWRTPRWDRFDVVFTVFGPSYRISKGPPEIVGFAKPQLIYVEEGVNESSLSLRELSARLKRRIQTAFFKRADKLVVELEHVADRVIEEGIKSREDVFVVKNCISGIYFRPDKWATVSIPREEGRIALGFVGRDYRHKNTAIFPYIVRELREAYHLDVDLYVTFTQEEWDAKDQFFRSHVRNAGQLQVAQCPDFYAKMDGVVFPSLLECFSATPLEALYMERPLFASDRKFVRDVCGPFAHYFEPLDASEAAKTIAEYYRNRNTYRQRLSDGKKHAEEFSDPESRASRYMDIIRSTQ